MMNAAVDKLFTADLLPFYSTGSVLFSRCGNTVGRPAGSFDHIFLSV